jgi:hypothetical protein
MNILSPSAINRFSTQIISIIEQDLDMSSGDAETFAHRTSKLLLKEQHSALPQIARSMEEVGIKSGWNQILWRDRSDFLAQWMAPHIVNQTLDLMCGHGQVAASLINLGFEITVTERENVYPLNWCIPTNIPYIPLSDLIQISSARKFETVILSTILHHEKNPKELLALASSLATKKLIIVENCLEKDFPADYQFLMDVFFNSCLNSTHLDSPAAHQPVDELCSLLGNYGNITHVERTNAVPGVPLSHHLLVVEVS